MSADRVFRAVGSWQTPARVLEAVVLVGLAGCATPGLDRAVSMPMAAETVGLSREGSPLLSSTWWRSLGDARLDGLVEQALRDHPSLTAARARVDRVAALADQARSATGPQSSLSAEATRQRYSAQGMYPAPLAGNHWNSGSVQATVSWSPDFFGRHDADWRSALGQSRAAEAEAVATRLTLATQVTRTYVALARWGALQEVARQTLAQRQHMLRLTRQRVQAGLDTQVELARAEGAVPDAQAQIEALDEQMLLARHQLAALTAQPTEALADLSPRLSALRIESVPARLGADLLGRRPEVVAARWRVEAAMQDVRGARAQFYPDVNLTAFAGLSALGLDRVFELDSRQYGAGPALRLPLFDGGRLRAQLEGRQADLDAAVAQYNAALLDAVREVGDALGALPVQVRQIESIDRARASAEKAHDFATRRYQAGLTTQLTVLDTETQVLAQRRQAVELQARRLDTQVQLMRALGGGWQDAAAVALPAPPILNDLTRGAAAPQAATAVVTEKN